MIRAVALSTLVLLLAAGCDRERRRVIGVVPKSTSNIFWVTVEAGARRAGSDLGADIEWNGAQSESDITRQIQIIDSMIVRRLDAIAVAASERKALAQVLDRAAAARIPITVFDSGVDSQNYLTFVSTNNYEAGRMAAERMASLLGGKGKIGVLLHAPGSFSTMDRERGFADALREKHPGLRIVASQYGLADRAKAVASAENILTAHPDLDGFFASSEPSASGVSLALAARGLGGKVKFVAFDSSDTMIADLRRGLISATVVQDPFRIGYEAVRTLSEKLRGGTPPKRIDLDARVISKDDLTRPDIIKLLALKP
ncbi:MAG: substrate-binding domain-containing protein [Bryobacterales bacterium]|nr:substrate-binding domain-containing protein [Bryobacterales bacterium]